MSEVLEIIWVQVDFDDGATVKARIRHKGEEKEVYVELECGWDGWVFSVSDPELSIPEQMLLAGAVLVEASRKDEQLRRFIKHLECIYYNYVDACIEEGA